jgi:nitrogenase molybdenum-cofactor synthesis protein NifE
MHNILRKERVDIMLSGGRTQFVALKAKVPWLDINQERHHAYAGYDGMVNLVRQIDLAVSSPIWERVRKRAPWESNEN